METVQPDQVSWFCLQSQPKREHIAAAHLRQVADIEVFCPRLRFKRPTKAGVRWFEEAMFPGYLFARFHIISKHKEVRSAMGINRILKFGNHYARVDDTVVAMLRSRTGADEVAIINSDVSEGDTVKVISGSLCGFDAVVTQVLSGRERVRLLLNFLGREIHAEISTVGILPAKRHPLAENM